MQAKWNTWLQSSVLVWSLSSNSSRHMLHSSMQFYNTLTCTPASDRTVTSVHKRPDRRTDGLTSWHKRDMYILHFALKTETFTTRGNYPCRCVGGAARSGLSLRTTADDVDQSRHDEVIRQTPDSARWQVGLFTTQRTRYRRRGVQQVPARQYR